MVGRPIIRAEEAVASGIVIKVSETLLCDAPFSVAKLLTTNSPYMQDIMCGDEAAAVRHSLECTYPVENGIVKHWEDMEHLWCVSVCSIVPSS